VTANWRLKSWQVGTVGWKSPQLLESRDFDKLRASDAFKDIQRAHGQECRRQKQQLIAPAGLGSRAVISGYQCAGCGEWN